MVVKMWISIECNIHLLLPSMGRKSGVEMWPAVVEAARPRLPQPTPRTVRSRCSSTCPWPRPWRPPRWGCTCSCQAFRQRDEQVGSHLRPHSHRWPSQTHCSELSGQQVGSPTHLWSGPYDTIFVGVLVMSQFSNLWRMPNSFCKGFGPAIRMGQSSQFQWSPTTYMRDSSQFPLAVGWYW